MKKSTSVVWLFFERVEENGRVTSVACKLCDRVYKFFGNTTNLRSHLTRKHPVQWELSTGDGAIDEATLRNNVLNEVDEEASPPVCRKRKRTSQFDDVETENDQLEDEDHTATVHLVGMQEKGSDEEWLEDPFTHIETYETRPKKYKTKKIKRERESPLHTTNYFTPSPAPKITFTDMKDEYSVFGEYVANKLRKFKVARTRGNLQQLITTILWQAEYGVYDNAEAVRAVLIQPFQHTPSHATVTITSENQNTEIDTNDTTIDSVTYE